MQAAFT
jgi:hypothetical protein